MAGVPASALASPRSRSFDRYYFVVDVDRRRGASLGLVLSARPDGFLVEEIASRDGTDADALVGGWNRACAATHPRAMVQTGDVLVRVNHAGVSAVPGADCCNDLRRQLAMCQPLLLLLSRPHPPQRWLPQRESLMLPQDLLVSEAASVHPAASRLTDVAAPVDGASAPATVVSSTLAVVPVSEILPIVTAPDIPVVASVTRSCAPVPAASMRCSSCTPAVTHVAAAAPDLTPAVAAATCAGTYAEAAATPAVTPAQLQYFRHYFATQARWLPTPRSLGVHADRPLEIYTWGTTFMHAAVPGTVQYNFDATVLDARGGDADMRLMTGLCEEVQANLAGCRYFDRWLATMISRIEQSTPPLRTISIYCEQGHHRSVAAAEILRQFYYRNARVRHLTINRRHLK